MRDQALGRNHQRSPSSILVVEDESALRSLLVSYLAQRGYQVTGIATVDDAIELIRGGMSYGLILTDVKTPGRADGVELARQIVQRSPDVQVIVMSGYAVHLDMKDVLSDRVVFLQKPFWLVQLDAMIRRLIDGDSKEPQLQQSAEKPLLEVLWRVEVRD